MKKLVRDNIPKIIEESGEIPVVSHLDDAEYLEALKAKLVEEAKEVMARREVGALIEELADVLEIVAALRTQLGVRAEELERVRVKKAQTNGGFTDRVFLEAVKPRTES